MQNFDIVIVGGGIIGLTVARELIARHPSTRIAILEKELSHTAHGSGRNSGVLHSGIYYPPDSLKARFCATGARALSDYCIEHDLPLARLGKVIVPVNALQDQTLDLLIERARANGAHAEVIDSPQLRELEPETHSASGRALHVPDTAVIDPRAVIECMANELKVRGVTLLHGEEVVGVENNRVHCRSAAYEFDHLVNAAGLHADRIARMFEPTLHYTIVPFRGSYMELRPGTDMRINGLIYPVPDLRVPFLGVHYTKAISGKVYVGPTAVPALGRENYSGMTGITASDAGAIGMHLMRMYISNQQGFRTHAHTEAARMIRSRFVQAARMLTPRLAAADLIRSNKVGIRAQLVDTRSGEMVMDYAVESLSRSTHVLNAVSPGFTSAMAFAGLVADRVEMGGETP